MIVVDNTVLADAVMGNPDLRAAALRLSKLDPVWISVGFYRYEMGNVAWKMARFGKGWSEDAVRDALQRASALLSTVVLELDWVMVMEISLERQVSYYDASYVWLAESRGVPLYSRDERLRKKCPEVVRAMPEE